MHACRTQFNLHDRWSDNLITCALPVGEGTEQLIGRTVRDGQPAEEVTVEFLLTVAESYRDLAQAFADARASSLLEGGQPKKLCYGECTDSIIESIKNGEHAYAST